MCLMYARNKTDIINRTPHHNRIVLVDKIKIVPIITLKNIILIISDKNFYRDIYGHLIEC